MTTVETHSEGAEHRHDHAHAHGGACGHDHAHHHHGTDGSGRRLALAFAVIASFAVIEVIGGLVSGSLALLADAGHMITDAAALALALSAQWLARRPVSDRFPFGFKRAQVLAAFINGLGLLAIVVFLVIEAIERLGEPQVIDAGLMLGVAVVGLLANFLAFFVLHGKSDENVNVKGAMLHVAADIFGSVAAIVSAFVIMATGFYAVDALLTVAVCLLILRSTVPLLRETGSILLQAAPSALSPDDVRSALTANANVLDVHHVRAWQLTPNETMIALHAVVAEGSHQEAVLLAIKRTLKERFGIEHSTVQIEMADAPTVGRRWAGCPDQLAAE